MAGKPAPIVADIRAGLKDRPPWEFYHSWKRIVGAPSPADYGHVDAETATQFGVFAWDLIPYQADFLAQPELKTGAFLTVGDNGVNPWFTFAIGQDWPPGDYVVRVRVAATKQATPERKFLEFGVQSTLLNTREVVGTMDAAQVIEVPYTLTKDRDRSFFFREKGTMDSNLQANHKQALGARRNGIGPEFALWVDWAEVVRKPTPGDRIPPGLRALGIPIGDDVPPIGPGALRDALGRFATEACRGNAPPPGLLDKLVGIYDRRRGAQASHEAALKETLAVVLASPRFLYLAEPSPSESPRLLTANELAIRLSFFLWGGPPDATLRDLAARGELLKPEILAEQTNRLIDDPRSVGFVRPFVHQWLGLDRLDFFRFNIVRHLSFDDSVKMAARTEVYETFGHLLRQDASLRNLLKSDFVVINSLLANYYGIEGVTGDGYRKVAVPAGSPRGGLLGMAAILAMGSNGEQTSPVERGAWVLRKLLDDPPPPAPANVPAALAAREQAADDPRTNPLAPAAAAMRELPPEDRSHRLRAGELRRCRPLEGGRLLREARRGQEDLGDRPLRRVPRRARVRGLFRAARPHRLQARRVRPCLQRGGPRIWPREAAKLRRWAAHRGDVRSGTREGLRRAGIPQGARGERGISRQVKAAEMTLNARRIPHHPTGLTS